jgi:hypothetical protein
MKITRNTPQASAFPAKNHQEYHSAFPVKNSCKENTEKTTQPSAFPVKN